MQANTWPQGSNLASAVLPHKRHFTSVSLLTADNDLAWAESVSSREGGVASSGFLADALMENRSMNWVKKEQPSFTTTPLIAPQSSKRHKGLFFRKLVRMAVKRNSQRLQKRRHFRPFHKTTTATRFTKIQTVRLKVQFVFVFYSRICKFVALVALVV